MVKISPVSSLLSDWRAGNCCFSTSSWILSIRCIFFLADCTWDFFTCTRRYGKWPSNKPCCQARFDDCCMFVMGKKKPMMTTTTSTARPAQDATPPDKDYLPPDPSKPPSPNTPNEEQMTETRPTPPPLTTTTTTVSTPRPYDDNVKLSEFGT